MVREAHAIGNDGPYAEEGTLSTPIGVLDNSRYTFGSLTGPEASTSPCEVLAAMWTEVGFGSSSGLCLGRASLGTLAGIIGPRTKL